MNLTQDDLVLKHLEEHGSITSLEAINRFGATRLSAIIYRLRHYRGLEITTEYELVTTRYGVKTSVARYFLKPENE